MRSLRIGLLFGVALSVDAAALEPKEGDLYVRVVDVGAGHCSVIEIPSGHYMVYDAGNYEDGGATCFAAVEAIIPKDKPIDMMVLSHTDSDHLGGVDEILGAYTVKKVLRSGLERDRQTWIDADHAIAKEKDDSGFGPGEKFEDINLKFTASPPGTTYSFGDTVVTMVTGYNEPPASWDIKGESEYYNAGSIVIRVVYKDRSILFTGDTVGRHLDDPPDACIAAEKEMVEKSDQIPIKSDVLIAPHHGADNGSSTRFIQAVNPEFVIFPAGHKFEHPRKVTAERYLAAGVKAEKMFRTDRGDDEGPTEWNHERVNHAQDVAGDDDVDIVITKDGQVNVAYRNPG